MSAEKDVWATYLFPNGMVATVNFQGEQIGELQGKYTEELEAEIKARSSDKTEWHGYGKNNGRKPDWMH